MGRRNVLSRRWTWYRHAPRGNLLWKLRDIVRNIGLSNESHKLFGFKLGSMVCLSLGYDAEQVCDILGERRWKIGLRYWWRPKMSWGRRLLLLLLLLLTVLLHHALGYRWFQWGLASYEFARTISVVIGVV